MICFLQFLYIFDRKAKGNRDDSDRNAILLKCFCIIIALLKFAFLQALSTTFCHTFCHAVC